MNQKTAAGLSLPSFIGRVFAVACVAGSLVASACSGGELSATGARDNETPDTPNAPLVGPCEGDVARACVVTVDSSASEYSCYKGTQVCTDGIWSECQDGEGYTLTIPKSGSLRPQALGPAQSCSSNPCDPYCKLFDETPDGGLVTNILGPDGGLGGGDGSSGPTVPFDWASGTFNSVPTATLYELFNEPCTGASDCQGNTYCRAPDVGSCGHSVCEEGSGLTDGCSTCVTDICALDPDCCTDVVCAHDPCRTGAALDALCNECVSAICDVMPTCCSGSWSQACVDAISTTCQPPTTPTTSCGCAATDITASGGSCLRIVDTNRSWSSARSDCQAMGTGWDLAAITTSGDEAALQAAISQDTWIGATDSASEGDWRWIRSGTAFWSGTSGGSAVGGAYQDWASGQPNDYGGQDCGETYSGRWNDESCSVSQPYVCQGPPDTMQGGGGPLAGGWDSECVSAVDTVCGAICESGTPTPSDAVCTPWWAGETSACAEWDLGVGLGCSDSGSAFVTLCNHGQSWAPPGIKLAVFPPGSGEFRKVSPDMNQAVDTCTASEAVPPGWCINVGGCSGLVDGAKIIANPVDGTELAEECHFEDNWGVYFDSSCGAPLCSGTSTRATIKPINLFFVVDRSGSMDYDSPSRWASTIAALKAFFSDETSAGIGTELRFFPSDNPAAGCNGSACDPSACAVPQVDRGTLRADLAPMDGQEAALINALNTTTPNGSTPMRIALEGALSWSADRQSRFPNDVHAVILVTDGEPNDCGNASSVATAAANGYANGVPTYVIGIEGVSQSTIDSIATSGGGQSFFVSASKGGVSDQLVAAIKTIAEDVIDCEFPLSNPQNLDADLASVNYVPRPPGSLGTHCLSDQGTHGDHCYYADSHSVNYDLAAANCRTLGAGWELASIGSSSENDAVKDYLALRSTGASHFGLNRDRSSNWAWMSGETVSYTGWASGEPNGSGNCGVFDESTGTWVDGSCGSSRDYVCEGPKVGATTGFCAAGQFSGSNGHCYKVLTTTGSWSNRRSACQGVGSGWDLAVVDSEAENDVIAMHLTQSSWLGGSDTTTEGDWRWLTGTQFYDGNVAQPGCPAPSVQYGSGNCYLKRTDATDWDTARLACQGVGSGWKLVDIASSGEQDFVWGLAGEDVWTGGNDLTTEGAYYWTGGVHFSNDGSPVSGRYNNWYRREPNGNGDCIRMYRDGGWSDWRCDASLPYVCEGAPGTLSGGVSTGFTRFASGEPNSATDDCLVMDTDGTWRDGTCSGSRVAVCEGPETPQPGPPAPPSGGAFDAVNDASVCSNDAQWYYDDNASPTAIHLCPDTCDRIRSDVTARLSIEVGCLPAAAPPPNPYATNTPLQTTYSEIYSAECLRGEQPQWSFAFLDSTTPGASNVTVRLRSAETEAGLLAQPWQDVVVLSQANGNELCGAGGPAPDCPLVLYSLLGSVHASDPFIELQFELNPDGTNAPTLNDWQVSYSCPPAE